MPWRQFWSPERVGYRQATRLALARAGHGVFGTMRDPAKAPERSAVAAAESLPIRVWSMGVDLDDSVRRGVAGIVAEHGPIDALVNNAGIERRGSIQELALAEFRAVMETNYFGAIRCMQAVLPGMRARGRGCIVNISSVAGRIPRSPLGLYAALKFALEAISEAVAQEVKSLGVRPRSSSPGRPHRHGSRHHNEGAASIYRTAAGSPICSPRR